MTVIHQLHPASAITLI